MAKEFDWTEKTAVLNHLRTQQEDIYIWYDHQENFNPTILDTIIRQEQLPYLNNGCFMECHSYNYIK